MRVLVTGGRYYAGADVVARCLRLVGATHVIEGGMTGADAAARRAAEQFGIGVETHHAAWSRLGRRAGPERNARMLRDGKPDLVLAFPGGAGTASMVGLARAAGVPVVVVTESAVAFKTTDQPRVIENTVNEGNRQPA